MKRKGNILERTAANQNIILAWINASKNQHSSKSSERRFSAFMENLDVNLTNVQDVILSGVWTGIKYNCFQSLQCGKVRDIAWNASVRDSVIQHSLAQTAGKHLLKSCIRDTFSGFLNRGTEDGRRRMVKFLGEYGATEPIYIYKFDVHHFYQSIDNEILKKLIEHKIKDETILSLFNCLIDAYPTGRPIGDYLSQPLANFYFSPYDHFSKDKIGCKHYLRYCDDVVVLSNDKHFLQDFHKRTVDFLHDYHLEVKPNWQIFPIERHGIDFMGYVFKRNETRLRKRIERNIRKCKARLDNSSTRHNYQSVISYNGWAEHLTKGGVFWNAIVGKTVKDLVLEMQQMEKAA